MAWFIGTLQWGFPLGVRGWGGLGGEGEDSSIPHHQNKDNSPVMPILKSSSQWENVKNFTKCPRENAPYRNHLGARFRPFGVYLYPHLRLFFADCIA